MGNFFSAEGHLAIYNIVCKPYKIINSSEFGAPPPNALAGTDHTFMDLIQPTGQTFTIPVIKLYLWRQYIKYM